MRGTRLIGLSADSVVDHPCWASDIADLGGAAVNFPILDDPDLQVAALQGMCLPNADAKVSMRAVFLTA